VRQRDAVATGSTTSIIRETNTGSLWASAIGASPRGVLKGEARSEARALRRSWRSVRA
jgi:hypothetical protein